MVRLGFGGARSHVINRVLKGLRMEKNDKPNQMKKRLVGRKIYGAIVGQGALSDLYYLTTYGAEFVARSYQKHHAEIIYPKSHEIQLSTGYWHRVAFVDVHIALVQWIIKEGYKVDFLLRDFNHGADRKPHTFIQLKNNRFLIPDGLVGFIDKLGIRYLFIVEVHMGYRATEIYKQLKQHLLALDENVYQSELGVFNRIFIYSIYQHDSTMRKVQQMIVDNRVNYLTLEQINGE